MSLDAFMNFHATVGQTDKTERDDTKLEQTSKASISRVPTPETMLVRANNR